MESDNSSKVDLENKNPASQRPPSQQNKPKTQSVSQNNPESTVQDFQPPSKFQQKSQNGQLPPSSKRGNNKPKMIALIVFVLVAALGVVLGAKLLRDREKKGSQEQAIQPTQSIVEMSPTTPVTSGCEQLPEMLEDCTQYSCEFTHPFNGELMTREVQGIVDGSCRYTEEMPNSGLMECSYTEEMRQAAAQYYRDLYDSGDFGADISVSWGTEGSDLDTTYTIDGEVVENPLQEALNSGQCVVTGY